MSDGSGSAKDQRENEPRPAIAPVMRRKRCTTKKWTRIYIQNVIQIFIFIPQHEKSRLRAAMHTSRWLPIWLVVRQKVLRKIGLRPLSHQTEPICFSLSELRNWLDHTTMRPTTMSQAFEERHSESAAQARRIFFGLGSPEHASGGVNTMKHRIGTSKEVISLLM
jgi:hypothetical protein